MPWDEGLEGQSLQIAGTLETATPRFIDALGPNGPSLIAGQRFLEQEE